MDNKKVVYACAICGNTYDEIEDRTYCESICMKRKKDEMKKVAEAKRLEEYEARAAEVDAAIDHALELREKLFDDYGINYAYNNYKRVPNNPYMMVLKHFCLI